MSESPEHVETHSRAEVGDDTACPDEDELVRLVEGALADASLARIESHVDGCAQCAAVIGGLGALGAAAEARRVGRYQLDRRIASGGMGEVWAAWDPQLRREIAVKLVRPDRADDDRERERLLREARALARLGHPNVLAVHDVGEIDGEVFLATELVAGDTLATRAGPNADWRVLAGLYAQAARGLAAAHAAGLVHRDVKPANLLLGTDGRVRVADFGLAVRSRTPVMPSGSTSEGDASVTASGHIAGTPAYMAPEQRAGAPADARVDQYALCVALAEAIVGRRPAAPACKEPIDQDGLIAFVAERRAREPELDALCGVIARGLSTEPSARFPDANALADAIELIVAPAPRAPVANAPAARRARTLVITAVAAIAGVATVLVIARSEGNANRGPAEPPVGNANLATGEPHRTGSASPNLATGEPHRTGSASPNLATGEPHRTGSASPNLATGEPHRTGSASPNLATGEPRGIGSASAPSTASVAAPATNGSGTPPPKRDVASPHDPSAPPPSTVRPAKLIDVQGMLAGAQSALNRHDARGCHAALVGLPQDVLPSLANQIDLVRARCEMASGDCERGIQRANKALEALGSPANTGDTLGLLHCPITGDVETRLKRLLAQVSYQPKNLAWCSYYLPAARAAASQASERDHRTAAGVVLRTLARCVGESSRCDEARELWTTAHSIDSVPIPFDVAKCP